MEKNTSAAGNAVQIFEVHDDKWAKVFIEDPVKFNSQIKKNATTKQLLKNTVLDYDSKDATQLLGSMALFSSHAIRPNEQHIATSKKKGGVTLWRASDKCHFLVYDTCCPDTKQIFLKVIPTSADFLDYVEVEAVALSVIGEYMPTYLKQYFLGYNGITGKMLCKFVDSVVVNEEVVVDEKVIVPFHNYVDGSILRQQDLNVYPFIATQAVPGAITLRNIVLNVRDLIASKSLSQSESKEFDLFFGHDAYLRFTKSKTHKPMIKALHDKLEEIFIAAAFAGKTLHMSHCDLHADNVLFDVKQGTFVVIDFGRAALNLTALNVNPAVLLRECQKVSNANITKARIDKWAADPNSFYDMFVNANMRVDFNQNESNLCKYGMMLDLAGLAYDVLKSLPSLATIEPIPFVSITHEGKERFISFWSLKDISEYMALHNKNLSVFQYSLIMFAMIFWGIVKHHRNIKVFKPLVSALKDEGKWVTIPAKLLIGGDQALFYAYGQPLENIFKRCKPGVEKVCDEARYFVFLEDALEHKAGTLKTNELVGGSKRRRKITINETELTRITFKNYKSWGKKKDRMKRRE